MKTCNRCLSEKEDEEFFKDSRNPKKTRSQCKKCCNEGGNSRRHRYSDKIRNRTLERKYGITLQDVDNLTKNQNNKCKICQEEITKKNIAVDHCHETGKIRGVLCKLCNTGLGAFADDICLVQRAASYLLNTQHIKSFANPAEMRYNRKNKVIHTTEITEADLDEMNAEHLKLK